MPVVNVQITKDGTTAEQKARIVAEMTETLQRVLGKQPEHTHIMLKFKAGWVQPQLMPRDRTFRKYPKESIADWHERLGLEVRRGFKRSRKG